MPRAAPSFSPLQLFAPIILLVCAVLFVLPWIEIQVVPPPSEVKNMPKERVEMVKKEIGIDPTKPIGIIAQSGFQIANGTASLGSDMKRVMDKMQEKLGTKMEKSPEAELNEGLKKEEGVSAPLLFLYPVVILGGIVLGCIPWAGIVRKILVASCCAAAIGIIGLQAVIGFPLETKIKEKSKDSRGGGMFAFPGMGGMGGGGGKADSKEADPFRVAWNIPLYLAFLLLLSAAGTAFLGPAGAPTKYKKRRYDDDDEEDDGDRPGGKRKKSRYDEDDEDDEDRPRKKRRRDEDDEDDRPRGKRRRDEDDDEDDRPRKKRRRDDEDDEDDRPRKKKASSRDEDEEDNPPPKKKPAAPAFEVVDESAPAPTPQAPKPFGSQRPGAPKPAAPAPPPPPAPAANQNPFAFDDDEPKPKKKPRPRDDDEDDDDRPRKKRRRDDDD
jgi:hypothetical protein